MFEAKKSRVYTTILSGTACALLAACGTAMMSPPRIVAEGAKWEEVSRAGLFTAEGVVAARDGMIYATDITRPEAIKHNNPGGTIYRYDPSTGVTTKFMEPSGMANGLHVDRNGDLIIAQEADGGGRAILRRNLTSGATTVLANSYQGKRLTGPNDVTSDARGRIYFTDARYFGDEAIELPNAVYRIDPDGKITQLATDILRPNGIEVSPDGRRLYVAASNIPILAQNPLGPAQDRFGLKLGGIVVYDLNSDGNISNGRVFHYTSRCIMAADSRPEEKSWCSILPERCWRRSLRLKVSVPAISASGAESDATSLYMTTLFQWRLYRIKTVRRGHYFE